MPAKRSTTLLEARNRDERGRFTAGYKKDYKLTRYQNPRKTTDYSRDYMDTVLNGEDISSAAYVFSTEASLTAYRKYMDSPIYTYMQNLSSQTVSGFHVSDWIKAETGNIPNNGSYKLLAGLNEKIEQQIKKEEVLAKAMAPIFGLDPNSSSLRAEILNIMNGGDNPKSPSKSIKTIYKGKRLEKFLMSLVAELNKKDQNPKSEPVIEKTKKRQTQYLEARTDLLALLKNPQKLQKPQEYSRMYSLIFNLLQGENSEELKKLEGWSEFIPTLKGSVAEVLGAVALSLDLEEMRSDLYKGVEKISYELVGSVNSDTIVDAIDLTNMKAGSYFRAGSKLNPKDRGTTDIIINIPTDNDPVRLYVDVKFTKNFYSKRGNENVNIGRLLEGGYHSSSAAQSFIKSPENQKVYKLIAYLLLNSYVINGSIETKDMLLSPLLSLLFTTDDNLKGFYEPNNAEVQNFIMYLDKVYWFSDAIKGIAITYFDQQKGIGYYSLDASVRGTAPISKESFRSLKVSTLKKKYNKNKDGVQTSFLDVDYLERLKTLMNNKEITKHFSTFNTMAQSISVKAAFEIKLK